MKKLINKIITFTNHFIPFTISQTTTSQKPSNHPLRNLHNKHSPLEELCGAD